MAETAGRESALGPGGHKGPSRRGEIVSAAVEVFAERGYDGASIREIAERAGISKGNLTYYFAVKDDLLFEIVAELHDTFLRLAESWQVRGGRPRTVLRKAFARHVQLVCARVNATRVSYEGFRYLSRTRRAVIVDKRDRYEAALQRLITACLPAGGTADPHDALRTRTVLGMLNWPYQWYSPRGEVEPAEMAELVADMALRALGT